MSTIDEPLRLLVVDDDDVDKMALRRALKRSALQFELREANNARTGAALLESEAFDCAFLDYQLPGGDGLTLVKGLRNSGVKTPLIALTGQGDEETAVNLMKAGVSDYLPKAKLSSEVVERAIQNAIRIHKAEQEAELANQRLRETNALLRQQNQELEQQREQIYRKNLQREDFIARLTHDLRTPLVATNRVLEHCLQGTFGEIADDAQDALTNIASNNRNLLAMVNTLLEVYRHDVGRKQLALSKVSLRSLCEDIVQTLMPLAQAKGLEMRLDITEPDHYSASNSAQNAYTLQGDRLELRRLVTNLVGNAIKFTDSGHVVVRLRSHNNMAAKTLILEVEDTGPGIPEADQHQIFDRFRQGDHMRSGSGLGLHLAQRIAQLHGGEITFNSTLGKGSVFTLTLPIVR